MPAFRQVLTIDPWLRSAWKRSSTLHLPEQQGPGEAGTPERGLLLSLEPAWLIQNEPSPHACLSQRPLLLMLIAFSWCPIAGEKVTLQYHWFFFFPLSIIGNMLTQIKLKKKKESLKLNRNKGDCYHWSSRSSG